VTEPIVEGSVRLWTWNDARIEIAPDPPPDADDRVERRWAELLRENPRHFDGPILSVDSFESGVVHARIDRYKRLAVQPEVPTGVTLLAATGVITAQEAGREFALMIHRHAQTRHYGGMWEFGPSGGIDPTGATRLAIADIVALLQRELAEEAGLTDPLLEPRVACVYLDEASTSFDVVVRARLDRPVTELVASAGALDWDASDARWVDVADLAAFIESEPMIPPTIPVARAAGLIDR